MKRGVGPKVVALWLLTLTLLSPAVGQSQRSTLEGLQQNVVSLEEILAKRRLEEAGKDPYSLDLERKIAAKNKACAAAMQVLMEADRRFTSQPPGPGKDAAWQDYLVAHEALGQEQIALQNLKSALVTHRTRKPSPPTGEIEKNLAAARQRLAQAQAEARQPPGPGGHPSPPAAEPAAAADRDDMLSGEDAVKWLIANGYLNQDRNPGPRLRDWQSQSHSSLDRSGHPLRGVAEDWESGRRGRHSGDITILVAPRTSPGREAAAGGWDLSGASGWAGRLGDSPPEQMNLLGESPPEEGGQPVISRPPGYVPTYEEWLGMDSVEQRLYFEPMRARARAEHQAEMQEMQAEIDRNSARMAEEQRQFASAMDQARQEEERVRRQRRLEELEAQRLQAQMFLNLLARGEEASRRFAAGVSLESTGSTPLQPSSPSPSSSAREASEAPIPPEARAAFLQTVEERYKNVWYPRWCPKVRSGCSIVPKGAKDLLLDWGERRSSKKRQIDRLYQLFECYDHCLMAKPATGKEVEECLKTCQISLCRPAGTCRD
jgi:hypothetical protein